MDSRSVPKFGELADALPAIAVVAVVLAALVPYYVFVYTKRERIAGIPHVPSLLPVVGFGPAYFTSPSQNSVDLRRLHGDVYTMVIFGRLYCKIHAPCDVETLMRLPEKKASMLEAYLDLAGASLPQPDRSPRVRANARMRALLDPLQHSGTPFIAHSVRPRNLKAWEADIRDVLRQGFDALPTRGTVDLFCWCQDLISAVTVRMMLGAEVARDPALLQRFIDLFNQSDPERGFASPARGLATLAEVMLRGERRIFSQVRDLLFPLIDREIEECAKLSPSLDKEKEDRSALASLVSNWYHRKVNGNIDDLRLARTRIANDLFNFTFAAFSNSFGMSAWVLFHFLKDTKGLQSILREELMEPRNQSTHTYPRLEATILEIGRLYTPGDVHRKLREDWRLPSDPDVTLPKGTVMLVSSLTAHREASRYPRPRELDTGRDYRSAGGLFWPFGTGAHPCVGKRFALLEIALLSAEAIRQLDMTLVPGDKDGTCAFTNQVIDGVPDHPPLDLSQPGFIWRPAYPITVEYRKKVQIT